MKTEKEVLLKIYRRFSKNESILILKNKIKELEFKKGELISELEELKNTDKNIKYKLLYKQSLNTIKKEKEKYKDLEIRYFSLLAKTTKNE